MLLLLSGCAARCPEHSICSTEVPPAIPSLSCGADEGTGHTAVQGHGHLTAAMLGLASFMSWAPLTPMLEDRGRRAARECSPGFQCSFPILLVQAQDHLPALPAHMGCDGLTATSPALRWGIKQRGSDGMQFPARSDITSSSGLPPMHQQQWVPVGLGRWAGDVWGRDRSCLHSKSNFSKLRKLEGWGWGGGKEEIR